VLSMDPRIGNPGIWGTPGFLAGKGDIRTFSAVCLVVPLDQKGRAKQATGKVGVKQERRTSGAEARRIFNHLRHD
jgi:hypothetical protein